MDVGDHPQMHDILAAFGWRKPLIGILPPNETFDPGQEVTTQLGRSRPSTSVIADCLFDATCFVHGHLSSGKLKPIKRPGAEFDSER